MNTRSFFASMAAAVALIFLVSCHKGDTLDYDNDTHGNFEALWQIIDRRYCFLDRDGLDWEAVYRQYEPKARNPMSRANLFTFLSEMLDSLKDGHVNLSSPYGTSYYRGWWADYPQNYNERVVQQYYLDFKYTGMGSYSFGIIPVSNVGYIRISSFESSIGEGNLDWILADLSFTRGLIIDVRDNGGGMLTSVETIASRFITKRTLAGYISHKTGTGHNDFSEPMPYYYTPPGNGHIVWGKPVVVLANRSTFSAANNFVAFMRSLGGNIVVAGATTGGGSGMPFSSSLPCGWTVRFSACPMLDPEGKLTEWGVAPTPGHEVECTEEEFGRGYDAILEHAIQYIAGN